MRLVHGLEALSGGLRLCITVGVFDGLHRGHMELLGRLVRTAREYRAEATVIGFDPHPDALLRGRAPSLLSDPAETLERLSRAGVTITVVEPFDEALRDQTAEHFLVRVAMGRSLAAIVMSSESAFGRARGGTPLALRRMGLERGWSVVEVPALSLRGGRVSSGRIRQLVEAGRLAQAGALLGRPYAVVGEVVHGDGRGRELGYPTANLAFGQPVCLPPDGVYAVRASWGGQTPLTPVHTADGVASLGVRPMFGGGARVLEVHLLDRDVDLYGVRLRVEVVRRLRGQRRFGSIEGLIVQMDRDVVRTRKVLGAAD